MLTEWIPSPLIHALTSVAKNSGPLSERMVPGVAVLHGPQRWRGTAARPQGSALANRDGLGSPDHAVQHGDGEGSFALLTTQGAGAELRADQVLVSPYGSFGEVASATPVGLLPTHAALLGDQLDVAVPRVCAAGLLVSDTAEARGGKPTSVDKPCCRAAAR